MGKERSGCACGEPEWKLTGLHLSLTDGVTQQQTCQTCGATRDLPDELRNSPLRPKLPPTLPLRGIDE